MLFTKLNHTLAAQPKFIPTPQELELLNRAIVSATHSGQRFRVGAAMETTATHCNTKELHAEVALLISTKPKSNATMAVARLGKLHDWRCSYPCVECLPVIKEAGIRRLVCFNEGGQPVAMNV